MSKKKMWRLTPVIEASAIILILFASVSFFWNPLIGACELGITAIAVIALYIRKRWIQNDLRAIVLKAIGNFGAGDREALESFPLPAVVTGIHGDIIWYNDRFRDAALSGEDMFGKDIKSIARSLNVANFAKAGTAVDVNTKNRRFTVYGLPLEEKGYILYWLENTELKNIVDEYRESRPVVAVVMIDNYDELMQNAREGEKTEIVNMVEKALLSWVSSSSGFIRHSDRDKYIFVMEERHLRQYIESRFDILDKVKQCVSGERMPATLSIGVGRGGRTFADTEEMARQALDMALGRGGDQAAVKSPSGFEYYGGTSKAVEKRTKVKTRIIASALSELIDGSDKVLIMGHKSGDLDTLGSSVALYRAVTLRGSSAYIVIDEKNSFVEQFMETLRGEGLSKAFVEPEDALELITAKTLLIIVDTHRKGFIESPEVYNAARTVVVIDHHRKMVDFIDNAVIFYHEPSSSSASEMVAELMQYISDNAVTSVEADLLLAGIMLDTRNFTVRTGIRTFEAAAYLRQKGANTSRVKLMFSGSMQNYKLRAKVVETAEIYRNCAISVCGSTPSPELRLVAPQAADDLLTITGIQASAVLYPAEDGIAVSARSMGGINVQLVMEGLGGGGNQTMAGVLLKTFSITDAKSSVKAAIDHYFEDNE